MRTAVTFALLLCLAAGAWAKKPACGDAPCPSKRDRKEAKKLYEAGVELAARGEEQQAYEKLGRATELDGTRAEYFTAREMARQQVVAEHVERGNVLLAQKLPAAAAAEFATALRMDPGNAFAAQRLRDALAEDKPKVSPTLEIVEDSRPVALQPSPSRHDFDFRGDSRGLWQQVAQTYGIKAQIDDTVTARPVRMTVQNVDFATAAGIAAKLTKTFWVPLTGDQILVAGDSPEARRQLEPMSLHTFYVRNAASPQELTEVLGILRNIFDIRYASISPAQDTLAVRAPQATMQAVVRFLQYVPGGRPQVMLDVHVYEVNRSVLRSLGVGLPLQYTLFNVPSEARKLLSAGGGQDLINQLIASGAINQGNVSGVEALIAQFLSGQTSIFSQPFATFGGGTTLSGLVIPASSLTASLNQSSFRSLTHITLRAGDNEPATLHIGSRYPILNASFAPIYNTPAISQVLGNLSYQAAFPSFTYEDLGLTFKSTPQIHGEEAVTLNTELSVKQLTGQSVNGVPVLSNREYKGMIRVPDGATAVMIGAVSESETRGLQGPPFLALIPGVRNLVSTTDVNKAENELLITITPHIVRGRDARDEGEIVMPSGGQ